MYIDYDAGSGLDFKPEVGGFVRYEFAFGLSFGLSFLYGWVDIIYIASIDGL